MSTKVEFIKKIADALQVTQADSTKIVNTFLDTVTDTLVDEGSIQFTNFGTFKVSERAAREGKNPLTGEKTTFNAVSVINFRTGKNLKDAINGRLEEAPVKKAPAKKAAGAKKVPAKKAAATPAKKRVVRKRQ